MFNGFSPKYAQNSTRLEEEGDDQYIGYPTHVNGRLDLDILDDIIII